MSIGEESRGSKGRLFTNLLLEHLPYLTILCVCISAGFVVANMFGRDSFSGLTTRFEIMFLLCIPFFICMLFVRVFMGLGRSLASVIEIRTGKARIRHQNPRGIIAKESMIGSVIAYLTIPVFLSVFSNVKQLIPAINPFAWDTTFMRLDYVLHGGKHPWILLQTFLGYPSATKVIDYIYVSWFLFLFTSLIWMGWSKRRRLRSRFFTSFVLIWALVGIIMATVFSSAGPCYYSDVTSGVNPYRPLMSYLDAIHGNGFLFARKFQRGLWEAYSGNVILLFGGISAMPSVHVATAVLYALVGWRINRVLGILLTLYAMMIQIGSVHLGWHYAIDGYVGAILTGMIWKGSKWLVLLPDDDGGRV